jgi:transcriptional regulator with XRE-family HTH domain
MTSTIRKADPGAALLLSYDRGMLRAAFVSLFWACIAHRKKEGKFSFQTFAAQLGVNKSLVSRWFKGDPNWSVNTIASIANALNLDIEIQAKDRVTGVVYTPTGIEDIDVSAVTASPMSTNGAAHPPGVFAVIVNESTNPSGWATINDYTISEIKRFGLYANPTAEVSNNIKQVMAA